MATKYLLGRSTDVLTLEAGENVALTKTGTNLVVAAEASLDTVPPHHTTHEPGGTDALLNVAWTDRANTFADDQTIDGDLFVTGTITPLTATQRDQINALIGDPTGARTLMSSSYVSGLSLRHDESLAIGRVACGNYETQTYQPLVFEVETFQVHTGLSPATRIEHLRVHPSGAVTLGAPPDHASDPGVGILRARSVDLPEGLPAAPAADVGRLYTVDDQGFTFPEMQDSGGGTARLIRDNIIVVKALEPVARGQAVYIAGGSGANAEVRLAKADAAATLPAMGLAIDTVAANGFLRVVTSGLLGGPTLDTSPFAEGSRLYVSAITAGAVTTSLPAAPAFIQRIGVVTRQHATQGAILVQIGTAEAQTVLPHHTTHETGGADAITALDGSVITAGIVTDQRLSANVLKVGGGFPGGTTTFLRADGGFQALPASTPTAHHTTHEPGGSDAITALSAAVLTSGTLPDARFPATLPAVSGANLTNLDASDLATGTVPEARLGPHATKHAAAGADPVDVKTLAGYPGGTTLFLRADATFAATSAGSGNVVGPASAVSDDVVVYDGTTGKVIKDTGIASGQLALKNVSNTFTANQVIDSNTPRLKLWDPSQPADAKKFEIASAGQLLYFQALNDAENTASGYMALGRTGNVTVSGALTVNGTGSGNPGRTSGTLSGRLIIEESSGYYGLEIKGSTAVGGGQHASIIFNETAGAVNQKKWRINCYQNNLNFERLSDAEDSVPVSALQLYANGNAAVALNLTALTVRSTGGNIWVGGNLHNTAGYIYPGRADSGGGEQGSWYLGSHGSYGLYCSTGLYSEGPLWMQYIEARQHIRAAAGLYDYNRGTPIGDYVYVGDLSAVLSTGSGAMYHSFVGHTYFFHCHGTMTTDGVPSLYLGNWVTPSYAADIPMMYHDGAWKVGFLHFQASYAYVQLWAQGGVGFPTGTKTISIHFNITIS